MGQAVILSAVRTAIGESYKGSLSFTSVYDIAKPTILEAIKRSGVEAHDVDDMVMGEVLQGGGDMARYLAVELGLPDDLPGLAVNRQCASGMSAVDAAAGSIMAGMDKVAIAGGLASMTQAPISYLKSPRPFGGLEQWLSPSHPDTSEAPNMNMMVTVGENSAALVGVSRAEQDEWSLGSHQRAVAAIDEGRFIDEIVPVDAVTYDGGTHVFEVDERPRRGSTLEKLASLPVLSGRPEGTVTAGNSSGLNDGAAALVLADRDYAEAHGLRPLATIRSWAAVGVPPAETGSGPSVAIPRALDRAALTLDDVSLFEVNEAFASMTVGTNKTLGLDPGLVNVNGGAVALGHPVAASGARIMVTLIHELRRRGGGIGVASLCAGGGMGAATVIEVDAP